MLQPECDHAALFLRWSLQRGVRTTLLLCTVNGLGLSTVSRMGSRRRHIMCTAEWLLICRRLPKHLARPRGTCSDLNVLTPKQSPMNSRLRKNFFYQSTAPIWWLARRIDTLPHLASIPGWTTCAHPLSLSLLHPSSSPHVRAIQYDVVERLTGAAFRPPDDAEDNGEGEGEIQH